MDNTDMFEAVDVQDPGLRKIPYPTAGSIPLPTDEDGWMDCDDESAQDAAAEPNPSESKKKKLKPKELIQQKLAELKRKAQQEAEWNAGERKEADKLNIRVEPKEDKKSNDSSSNQSPNITRPANESDRIIDDLFNSIDNGQTVTENKQGEETNSTLEIINEEIAQLEKEQEMKRDNASDGRRKKKKKDKDKQKDKKSKKDKKAKKNRKSKQDEDPELDPDFFKVPSPKAVKENEPEDKQSRAEKNLSKSSSSASGSRRRSRSPGDRSKHRSSDHGRHRERRREGSSSRDRSRYRHRESRSSRTGSRRSRSRSKERHQRDEQPFFIDKEKLRRIAIKRVSQMQAAGKSIYSTGVTPEDIAQISSGGASISELTSFCRSMARDSDDGSDNEVLNVPCTAEENNTSDMVQPLSRTAAIVMNIKNARQLPIQTPEEKSKLRSSFPVSSGTHHRKEEPNEWTPVPVFEQPKRVFAEPDPDADDVEDISILIARRLKAVKTLKTNPDDLQTKAKIEDLDKQTAKWSESKNLPGAFTGRVEAKILTPEQLAPSSDKRQQAWVKKDTFLRARPVQGGIGQFLLQKMGWNEGQGLGKQNEGGLEPLQMDFNTSRKGLTAPEERAKSAAITNMYDQASHSRKGGHTASAAFSLADKHPVSALMEICSRRKWQSPQFVILHESGPSHKKNFIMQVTVNGTTYQPCVASNNKKLAKTSAATVALQAMGMLPKEDSTTFSTPVQTQGPPHPPPPHLDAYHQPHMLSTVSTPHTPPTVHNPRANSIISNPHGLSSMPIVPNIDLSSFR